MQRRDHGRTGGQTIVDDDDDAAAHLGGPAPGREQLAALANRRQLGSALVLDVLPQGLVVAGLGVAVDPAALVHGADGELAVVGRADLAHQHHIELGLQLVGNELAHGHGAAWDGQHQRIPAAIVLQGSSQLAAGIETVLELHDGTPIFARSQLATAAS